jgi:Recombinase
VTRSDHEEDTYRVRVATAEERIVIGNHHPAYVRREIWEEVQTILRNNAPSRNRRTGCAVLQRIVGCGLRIATG